MSGAPERARNRLAENHLTMIIPIPPERQQREDSPVRHPTTRSDVISPTLDDLHRWPAWASVDDAAYVLDVYPGNIRCAIRRGTFPGDAFCAHGRTWVTTASLIELLSST